MADRVVRGNRCFHGKYKMANHAHQKTAKVAFFTEKNRDDITTLNLVPAPTILVPRARTCDGVAMKYPTLMNSS